MTKTKQQLRAEAVERLEGTRMDSGSVLKKLAAALGSEWSPPSVGQSLGRLKSRLIDLLTDDEPDCGQIADMSRKDGDRVLSGVGNVPETPGFAEIPQKTAFRANKSHSTDSESDARAQESDTREKLEAEVGELVANNAASGFMYERLYCGIIALLDRQAAITEDECLIRSKQGADALYVIENADLQDKVDELTTQVRQLEGDLKGTRNSRDHWQRVAGRNAERVGKLKHELEQARKYGTIWPHYEDGTCVEPFDKLDGFDSDGVQKFIYTTSAGGSWQLQDAEGHILNVIPNAVHRSFRTAKRPPLKACDGEPIEIGQVLYGESDGKAWEVEGFDRKRKWSVWAHDPAHPERHKCLKPEWLVHEQPDSWERIARDLRAINGDSYAHNGTADLGEIAERIDRLAKEGE